MVMETQNSQDFSYVTLKPETRNNMAFSFVSYAVRYNKTIIDWIFG